MKNESATATNLHLQQSRDIMVYQIVQGTSRKRRFKVWVVTIGVSCNVEMCFN